jgi:hypothetical protein
MALFPLPGDYSSFPGGVDVLRAAIRKTWMIEMAIAKATLGNFGHAFLSLRSSYK